MSGEKGVKLELRVPQAAIDIFDDLVGTFYGVNRADVARFFLLKGVHDNSAHALELAALRASAGGELEAPRPRPIPDGDRWLCPICREAAHRNRAKVLEHMVRCSLNRTAIAAAEGGS